MRVPVYQQQVTPQIPSTRTQVQVPEGATGVAVKPIDTSAGLAVGIEGLRQGLLKMQENREKFMLASAVNDYRRQNTEFLHAKDSGVFAKKGKDVFGISQAYDEFSTKTMEDIAKRYKMSGAARDRFVEATSSLYNASLSSVMQHEQRETDAAQQMEWKTMINDSLNAVALAYNDDAVCEENWKIMAGAIAQQSAPYGDQVTQSNLAEARSKYVMARLAPMLNENAKAADAFLKVHGNELTGNDKLKAQKAVDDKMDVIKVQEMTDRLVQRFRGNEQAALQFAHKNFEGTFENSLVSSLKSRYSELKIRSNRATLARGAAQNEVFKGVKKYLGDGGILTDEQIAQLNLSDEQKEYVLAHNERNQRFENIYAHGDKLIIGWRDMTEDERYTHARRASGITDAQYVLNVLDMNDGLRDGRYTEDDVKIREKQGDFSPRDGAMFKRAEQARKTANGQYRDQIDKNLEHDLKTMAEEAPEASLSFRNAYGQFIVESRALLPDDPNYVKKVDALANKIRLESAETYLKKAGREYGDRTKDIIALAKEGRGSGFAQAWAAPENVAAAEQRRQQMAAEGVRVGVQSSVAPGIPWDRGMAVPVYNVPGTVAELNSRQEAGAVAVSGSKAGTNPDAAWRQPRRIPNTAIISPSQSRTSRAAGAKNDDAKRAILYAGTSVQTGALPNRGRRSGSVVSVTRETDEERKRRLEQDGREGR